MSLALVLVLPHGQPRQGADQAGLGERTGQTSSDSHKIPPKAAAGAICLKLRQLRCWILMVLNSWILLDRMAVEVSSLQHVLLQYSYSLLPVIFHSYTFLLCSASVKLPSVF